MLKRYFTIYLATNVGVNGSSQERPDSAGFWGLAGSVAGSGSGMSEQELGAEIVLVSLIQLLE